MSRSDPRIRSIPIATRYIALLTITLTIRLATAWITVVTSVLIVIQIRMVMMMVIVPQIWIIFLCRCTFKHNYVVYAQKVAITITVKGIITTTINNTDTVPTLSIAAPKLLSHPPAN